MRTWYPYADLVIQHPKVYTVAISVQEVQEGKRSFPIIEDGGVAVKDGKIIAVGTAAEINQYVGAQTKVIDARGKTLIPGFIDSHMHAIFTGIGLRNIDMRNVSSKEEMLEKIKEKADATPDGEWFQANNWNELGWDVQEMPTSKELDLASPNNPCFCMRTCFHLAVVNSPALVAAGITNETPDPAGGKIGHFEDGSPNGHLFENAAMGLVQSVIPALSQQQIVDAIDKAGAMLNKLGITGVIDANLSYEQMRAYGAAYKQNQLSYRANMMFYLDTATGDVPYHLKRLDEMVCITGFGNNMLKLNAVKITLDGIPATFTSLMREPYMLDPTTYGSTTITEEELTQFCIKANERGWQVGIHAIGDATEDMALRAFAAADAITPIDERRNYIIHYTFAHEDQFAEIKRMKLGITMQPTISGQMGTQPLMPAEIQPIMHNCGMVMRAGIVCGGSSDSPIVPPDPFLGMHYAVTRVDNKGQALGGDGAISPIEALIMWTKNSAFFSNDDDKLGSIEVGNLADMVIVDRDFIEGDPFDIRNTVVEKTILDGKVVYEL